MTERFVRPAPGCRIRVPGRNFAVLPEAGDSLPEDSWLLRLISMGDLVEGEPDLSGEDDPAA